jgi:hypothetical protein
MNAFSIRSTLSVMAVLAFSLSSAEPAKPADFAGLICFWDFQENAGEPRVSKGPHTYALKEMAGTIERVEGGVFGPYAAKLKKGQWLSILRKDCPALDIHGKGAQVTVVAWIKRNGTSAWQGIAGQWDESRSKRQYCLFLNGTTFTDSRTLNRTPVKDRIHGHVSSVGGPTPGKEFCVTYSSSAHPIPLNEWVCIAMSYDGRFSRVYINGKLDSFEHSNPFPYDEGLYDGGTDGADFTVGSVSVKGKPGNFFDGTIGGLAVYNVALKDEDLLKLGAMPRN